MRDPSSRTFGEIRGSSDRDLSKGVYLVMQNIALASTEVARSFNSDQVVLDSDTGRALVFLDLWSGERFGDDQTWSIMLQNGEQKLVEGSLRDALWSAYDLAGKVRA